MLKLIFLLVLSTGAWAERLILSGFADLKSNLLFSQLEQYKGTSQTQAEAVATANAANCVLPAYALDATLRLIADIKSESPKELSGTSPAAFNSRSLS